MNNQIETTQVLGNLTKDVTSSEVNGKFVLNGSIAINKSYKDSNGETKEITVFYDFEKWSEKDSSKTAAIFTKGSLVLIEGTSRPKAYIKDDTAVAVNNIVAREIVLLNQKSTSEE